MVRLLSIFVFSLTTSDLLRLPAPAAAKDSKKNKEAAGKAGKAGKAGNSGHAGNAGKNNLCISVVAGPNILQVTRQLLGEQTGPRIVLHQTAHPQAVVLQIVLPMLEGRRAR